MYVLYYSPGTASMAVHQTLIELQASHELRKLDFDALDHKREGYLRLNPNGMVPTLVIDGAPYYECAALLMLLAERHPASRLAPAPGSPGRATFLQWMIHFANTLQPAFRQWFYPQDFAARNNEVEAKAFARGRIEAVWSRLDTHLASNGPFIAGSEPAVVDFYATMLMRWSRNMPKTATAWPAVAALAQRVTQMASWKRMSAIEDLSEWA